ncbi:MULTISPECIES: hypothetical protein [Arthrobacter]|uniref:hypothetical protein n=1 Tax=Arthrobacter TaxID=1663 RepID=UPI001F3DE459|nr:MULTISPECIES: hypothetical protein [Arthrobacter]
MNASAYPQGSSEHFPEDSPAKRPVRTGTIVWGLLIIAAAVLLLAWLLTDISFDPLAVLLGLLLGGGTALLIGGAISAFGGRNHFTSGGNDTRRPTGQAD